MKFARGILPLTGPSRNCTDVQNIKACLIKREANSFCKYVIYIDAYNLYIVT